MIFYIQINIIRYYPIYFLNTFSFIVFNKLEKLKFSLHSQS